MDNGCCGAAGAAESTCDPITSDLYGLDQAGEVPELATSTLSQLPPPREQLLDERRGLLFQAALESRD